MAGTGKFLNTLFELKSKKEGKKASTSEVLFCLD